MKCGRIMHHLCIALQPDMLNVNKKCQTFVVWYPKISLFKDYIATSQITYASPSWRGFIKAEEIARLNAILSKAHRFGYLPTDFHPRDDLLDASDESLFTSTRYNPQHILHQLLPPPKQISYNLRSRGHGLTLSAIPSEFMRKNFLYPMLYNDVY